MFEAPLPVLMYHAVATPPAGPLRSLAVPPTLLAEHLAALTEAGYALLGLTEALRRHGGPGRPVIAVTFDDGYRDFLTHGVPVLRDAGATATLYMAVGHAGGPADWLGPRAGDFDRLLTWNELRDVAAAGVEIGNHGLHHRPMDVLDGRTLGREAHDSRRILEDEAQTAVTSFCYPHGYHSTRVRAAVRRSGHANACEVGRALHRAGGDPLAVPRLHVTADYSGADLQRLVSTGGPRLLPRVKRAARPGWRLVRAVAEHGFGRRLT